MPYEDSITRQRLKRLGERRPTGMVVENQHPVRPVDTASLEFRDNALFEDQTGVALIGLGGMGSMMIGGGG